MATENKLESAFSELEQSIGDFAKTYWPYFLGCLALFLFFYFSEFAEYRLRADGEGAALGNRYGHRITEEGVRLGHSTLLWTMYGRWGTTLLEFLFFLQPLNPYFALSAFAACMSGAFLILCRAAQVPLNALLVGFGFVLFAGFPSWFYLIEFKGTLAANGLAVLFAAIAGYWLLHRHYSKIILSLCALVFAIAIYQSAIFVALSIALIKLISQRDQTQLAVRAVLFSLLKLFLLLGLAGILYLLTWKGILYALGLEPRYIQSFIRMDKLLYDPLGVLLKTMTEIYHTFAGSSPLFYQLLPISGVLFLLGFIALVKQRREIDKKRQEQWLSAGLFLLLICTPFLLNLAADGVLPYRSLLAVPFVYSFFALQALQASSAVLRFLAKAFALIIAIQFFQFSSFYSFSHHFTSIHDQLMVNQIYERMVEQVPDYERDTTYPLEIVGSLSSPDLAQPMRVPSSVNGVSLFEWDRGNAVRVQSFMHILGFGKFSRITQQQRAAMLNEVDAMPNWPAQGSVAYINDILVVKFTDYPLRERNAIIASQKAP